MSRQRRRDQGFTMVEMLVALLAASMLMMSLTTGMMIMNNGYHMTSDRVELQYQAQTTLNIMVDQMRHAKGIAASYAYETDKYETKQGEKGRQAIDSFCIHVEREESGTPKDVYVYYSLKDNTLYRQERYFSDARLDHTEPSKKLEPKKQHILATEVETMHLTPQDNKTIGEAGTVTVELVFKKNEEALTASSMATMRNK